MEESSSQFTWKEPRKLMTRSTRLKLETIFPRIKLFGISAVNKRKRDWLIDRDMVTSPVLLFSFVSRLLSCSWLVPKGGCCLFLPKGACFLFLYLFSVFVRCLVCVYSTLSRPRYAYLLSQTGRVVCD